jgi:hypothetical protein
MQCQGFVKQTVFRMIINKMRFLQKKAIFLQYCFINQSIEQLKMRILKNISLVF